MKTATTSALLGIGLFILAATVGPLVSHEDYSWISNTTSELAGQNMPNAWLMRLGFLGFGLATAVAAALKFRSAPLVYSALIAFGACMIAAAAWSHLPIDPALGGSRAEDNLHSVAASAMGVAFVAATGLRLWPARVTRFDWLSALALAASVLLPLAMLTFPMIDGLLQRMMFAVSFVWIIRETRRPSGATAALSP
jgi:Protein of unknown function (DUF998)